MSSQYTIAQKDDEIRWMLQLIGFSDVNKITSTLQGGIWECTETEKTSVSAHNDQPTKAIKVTNKYMHEHSISVQHNKTYKIVENILKERSILEFLTKQPDVPNCIVKYHGFFQSNSHFYLIMQHCGRSLFQFVAKAHKLICNGNITITEWHRVIKIIFKQMIQSVEYIHKKNCCHFDVSLENFLINDIQIRETKNAETKKGEIEFILDDLQIVLCDFGLSEYFGENSDFISNKWCGKANYQSPEINDKKYFNAKSNDIWCLGVCLWMVTVGSSPFKTANKADPLFLHMINGHLDASLTNWNKSEYVDDQWISLMRCFFQYENKRISIQKIKQHPWLK